MNKELIRIMNEMADNFLSADADSIKRHASMSIPGLVTFDGKDITEDILNRDDFKTFYCKNVGRFGFNQDVLRQYIKEIVAENKVDQLKVILKQVETNNDKTEQAIQSIQYVHSSIRKIISSINDLIPSEPDEKDKNAIEIIRFIIKSLKNVFDDNESLFYNSLKVLFSDEVECDIEKQSLLNTCSKESGSILLNLIPRYCRFSMIVMYLHYLSCDYFYGTKDKKSSEEFTNALYQLCLSTFPNILQMHDRIEKNGKKLDQLLSGQDDIKRKIDVQGDRSDRKLETIENKVEKKDREGKTKPLKLTTCLETIREVYYDPKFKYQTQFELHLYSIRNMLSNWNQYLNTGGKKGTPPLPNFDFYRHAGEDAFKKWVRDVFFLDYRNRAHKDALNNAFHPKDIEIVRGSDEQDIINEVDEDLAND